MLDVNRQPGLRVFSQGLRLLAGEREHLGRLAHVQLVRGQRFGDAATRVSVGKEGSVPPDPHFDFLAVRGGSDRHAAHVLRADIGLARLDQIPQAALLDLVSASLGRAGVLVSELSRLAVAEVEPLEIVQTSELAAGDRVQLVLEFRRELVVRKLREVLLEQAHDRHGSERGNQRPAAPERVSARLHEVHDGRPRAGPSDPQALQLLDQVAFRVALGRLGPVLRGLERLQAHDIVGFEIGQGLLAQRVRAASAAAGAALFVRRRFGIHPVGLEEPGEFDGAPVGPELRLAGGDLHRRRRAPRVAHLAGHGPAPDHLVELGRFRPEALADFLDRAELAAGRPDRFVSLLGVLDLVAVVAHLLRKELLAEALLDQFPRRSLGLVRERGRVGAHVGDEAVLVQLLSEAHRVSRLKPQLAVRVLLQAAGHVGRLRRGREGLALDRDDLGFRRVHLRLDVLRSVPVQLHPLVPSLARRPLELPCIRVEVLGRDHALAVHLHEIRFEFLAALSEAGFHPPEAGHLEADPGPLALHQQAHGHALHASGAEPGEHLLPEQRADFVAEQPVDDAAGFLGLDQVLVDRPRAFQCLMDRVAGDLVEDQPLEGHLRSQQLQEVPADGLPFAILVRCEVNVLRPLDRRLHLAHEFLLVLRDDVERLEVRVHVDARARPSLLLELGRDVRGVVGQVAHVAHRRLHDEVLG